METKNQITPINQNNENSITYKVSNGELVTLNSQLVKNLTNNNTNITNSEIKMFMALCQYQKLNPFIREAYLVKYDNNKPAQQITSLGAFLRIAEEHPQFDGIEDGIIVQKGNELIERQGTILLNNEILIGSWAKVYRKDRKFPTVVKLNLSEFNKGQSTWKVMPALMINKCAKVNALRGAFPSSFNGCYTEEEIQSIPEENDNNKIDNTIYDIDETPVVKPLESQTEINETTAYDDTPIQKVQDCNLPHKYIPYGEYKDNKDKYQLVKYHNDLKQAEVIVL